MGWQDPSRLGGFDTQVYNINHHLSAGFGAKLLGGSMNPEEVRRRLLAPYAGMLDASLPSFLHFDVLPVRRVHSYNLVWACLTRPEFSRDVLPLVPKRLLNPILSGSVVQPLGEKHSRLRQAVMDLTSQSAVLSLKPFSQSLANQLISQAVQNGRAFDLARIADQITYEVICELLGLEQSIRQADQRLRFFAWMDELTAATSPLNLPRQPEVWAFFRQCAKTRLALGQNMPIDRLLRSPNFTDHDKAALWHLTMTSATITTAYTICSAWALLRSACNNSVFEQVRQNALSGDKSLINRAYQETLRFATPTRTRVVRVRKFVKIDSERFWPGQFVEVCFPSANRDVQFRDPHVFDPTRAIKPPHISFGAGEYECPGRGLSATVAGAMLCALMQYAPYWHISDIRPGGRLILRMQNLTLSP